MSKQVTLPIPEDIYNQVESVAATTDRAVVDVLLETISQAFTPFPVNPQRAAIYENNQTELKPLSLF